MSSVAASVLRLSGLIDCDDAIWDDPSLLRYCCSSSSTSAQQTQHRPPQHEHSKHNIAAPAPLRPPVNAPPPPSRCPYQPPSISIAACGLAALSSCSSSSSTAADAVNRSTASAASLTASSSSSSSSRVAAVKPLLSSTGCELYSPSASSQLSPPAAELCAICLEPPRCAAALSDCSHRFCLACIRRWACVSTSCPLCKASFSSIRHGEGRQRRSVAVEPRRQRDVFDVDPSYAAFFASVPPPSHILAAACLRCGSDRDDHSLLLCDSCDAAYHIYCLSPPLHAVPADDWFCSGCRRGQSRAEAVWQEAKSRGQEASVDWEQLSPLSQFQLVTVEAGAEAAQSDDDSVREETERGRMTTRRRTTAVAARREQRQRRLASHDSRTREQLEDEVVRELFAEERENAAGGRRAQRTQSGQLQQQTRLRRLRDLDSRLAAPQQQQEEAKEADEQRGGISSRLRNRRRQVEEALLCSDSDDGEAEEVVVEKQEKDEDDEKEAEWQCSARKRRGSDEDAKEQQGEGDDADALQYSFVVPDDVVLYATDYEEEKAERDMRSRRRSSRGRDRSRDGGAVRRKRLRRAGPAHRGTPTRSSERETATALADKRTEKQQQQQQQQQQQPLQLRSSPLSSSTSSLQLRDREVTAVEDISQASTPAALPSNSPAARTAHLSFTSAATSGSGSLRAVPAFLSSSRQQRSRQPQ